MVTKRWLRLAAPTVLVLFGVTACGSGNGPAIDAWAKSVCQGMQSPVQQADTALADTGAVKAGELPKALQTRLAADFGTLAAANTRIAQAVQAAGAPKVTNGAQTQTDAVSELSQAAAGYTKVQQAVQGLAVTDQAKFAAGLKGVGDQVQQLAELSTGALTKLQTGDLGVALTKQPGCKSVPAADPAASATPGPSGSASGPTPSGSAASGRTTSSATPSGKASGKASAKPSGSASSKP